MLDGFNLCDDRSIIAPDRIQYQGLAMSAEATLTLSEFCRRVTPAGGSPVHPSTAYRWAKAGRLRVVGAGRRIMVPESAIAEFLESEAERWREKHAVPAPIRSQAAGDRAADADLREVEALAAMK